LEDLILFLKDADNVIENLNLYGNLIGDENTINICEALNASRECKIITLNLIDIINQIKLIIIFNSKLTSLPNKNFKYIYKDNIYFHNLYINF